jgi:hypothetical protein
MESVTNSRFLFGFFLVLFSLSAAAITVTPQAIPNVNGYTKDTTPLLTMILDGNTGDTNMSFSCNGSLFTTAVPFSSPYEQFSLMEAVAGCSPSDGSRTVSVRVVDSLLATDTKDFPNSIILDTTLPSISNQQPANATHTTNKRIPIGFDFSDSGSGITGPDSNVSLKINGTPVLLTINSGHASYITDSDFADGTVSLQADANDLVGNHVTSSWSFEVDTNAHLVSIAIDGNRAFTNSMDANISVTGDSDLNACHFKTTGAYGEWLSVGSIMHIQLETGDGNKTVTGQCKDELDNLTEEQSDSIGLETLAPGIPALSIVSIHTTGVDLRWTAVTDNGASGLKEYELFKNNSSVINHLDSNRTDYNVTGLSSGTTYTFRLVARDNAGNESFSEQTTTTSGSTDTNQTSDTVSPTVTWINPSNNAVLFGTTTLRVQVSDNRSLNEVSFYLDDFNANHLLAWVPVTGTSAQAQANWTPTNASFGPHNLIARVRDVAGNTAQASRSITIDISQNQDQNQNQEQDQNQDENQSLDFSFSLSFGTNRLSRQLPLLNRLEEKLDFSTQRIGLESDIRLTRKLDVFRIAENGKTRYKNRFTVEVKNLLPTAIGKIGVVEEIPKEWVSDANAIRFDHNYAYQILERDPVIQIFLDNLDSNQTAVFSYYFKTDSNENPVTQASFQQMIPPVGVITMDANDSCLHVACNDSNPCTLDYCAAGTCQTVAKPNGTTCGENMACQEENCVSTVPPQPPIDWNLLLMGGGIVAGLLVALLLVSFLFKKGKPKTGKKTVFSSSKKPPTDEELKQMLQQSLIKEKIISKPESGPQGSAQRISSETESGESSSNSISLQPEAVPTEQFSSIQEQPSENGSVPQSTASEQSKKPVQEKIVLQPEPGSETVTASSRESALSPIPKQEEKTSSETARVTPSTESLEQKRNKAKKDKVGSLLKELEKKEPEKPVSQ